MRIRDSRAICAALKLHVPGRFTDLIGEFAVFQKHSKSIRSDFKLCLLLELLEAQP